MLGSFYLCMNSQTSIVARDCYRSRLMACIDTLKVPRFMFHLRPMFVECQEIYRNIPDSFLAVTAAERQLH